jgi:hypothetical protein
MDLTTSQQSLPNADMIAIQKIKAYMQVCLTEIVCHA